MRYRNADLTDTHACDVSGICSPPAPGLCSGSMLSRESITALDFSDNASSPLGHGMSDKRKTENVTTHARHFHLFQSL